MEKSNPNKIIGFYDSTINIHAELKGTEVDVNTTAKLYPRLERSDTLDKYASEPDPVLPDNTDRCCYTYPDIYQDSSLLKKISITVDQILQEDNELSSPKYFSVRQFLNQNAVNFIDFRTI